MGWPCLALSAENVFVTHEPAAPPSSIGLVLLVGFAVHRGIRLLLRPGVVDNLGGSLLVSVRGVLDQFLPGEPEALRLATAGFLDGQPLSAATLGEVDEWVGGRSAVHPPTVLRWMRRPDARCSAMTAMLR